MLETEEFILSRNVFAHRCEGEALVSEEGLLTMWSRGAEAGVVAYTWESKRIRNSRPSSTP